MQTSAQDKADALLQEDTARRRAFQDQQKRATQLVPDEAKLHNMNLGGLSQNAGVVLRFEWPDGRVDAQMCELTHSNTNEGELVLTMVCVNCVGKRRRKMDVSQIRIHQKTHPFELDTTPKDRGGIAGELFVNPYDPSETVTIAGHLTMARPQVCPTCGWRFVIEKSRLRGV